MRGYEIVRGYRMKQDEIEIIIDPNKSTYENISDYYQKLKKIKDKIKRTKEEIKKTKKEIEEGKKSKERNDRADKGLVKTDKNRKVKNKWYHKFRWFLTHKGKLVVSGRNAGQNDELFLKHMDDNDLFFHADIPGGSVVILKNGINADENEKKMSAVFAGVYSRAWKQGASSIDVYHVNKEQLSKHSMKGYIGRGAFAIEGKRVWYKNTKLEIYIIPYEKSPVKLISVPIIKESRDEIMNYYKLSRLCRIKLIPGTTETEEIAKRISRIVKQKINTKINPGKIEYLIPGPSEIIDEQDKINQD